MFLVLGVDAIERVGGGFLRWGSGSRIRDQGRGFLVRSRNKDSEAIRAAVERPSDHDA